MKTNIFMSWKKKINIMIEDTFSISLIFCCIFCTYSIVYLWNSAEWIYCRWLNVLNKANCIMVFKKITFFKIFNNISNEQEKCNLVKIWRSFWRVLWVQILCEPIHYPQLSDEQSRRCWNTSCHARRSLSHGSMPTTLACPDNRSSQANRLQSALLVETKCGTEWIGCNAGHVSVPLVSRVISSLVFVLTD